MYMDQKKSHNEVMERRENKSRKYVKESMKRVPYRIRVKTKKKGAYIDIVVVITIVYDKVRCCGVNI